jgi:hypothetical protein
MTASKLRFRDALLDLLACDKGYVQFTIAEGAGAQCVSGARALLHERAFEWLSPRLAGAAIARSA